MSVKQVDQTPSVTDETHLQKPQFTNAIYKQAKTSYSWKLTMSCVVVNLCIKYDNGNGNAVKSQA